jgi:hypothetical protein
MLMPSKKARRVFDITTWWTRRAKKARRSSSKAWWTARAQAAGPWTLALVVCFVAAAVAIAARQTSPAPETTTELAAAVAPASAFRTSDTEYARGDAAANVPAASATVTGCLEQRNQTFRLTETSGSQAPKSRSWKSGFMKKTPAPIAVVDAGGRLGLPGHVGERVSVTGQLNDREMRASSVKRVAECD